MNIKTIKPHILACRSGDWNHALRVVKWVKVLGKGRSDINLLITTALIHDIGWFNVLPKGKINFKVMLTYEYEANKNSKPFATKLLTELNYNNKNIKTILRLISAADNHKATKEDEEIIVDADSLSKLSINHLKEKYEPDSFKEIITMWKKEMPSRFKTKKGKELFSELLTILQSQSADS